MGEDVPGMAGAAEPGAAVGMELIKVESEAFPVAAVEALRRAVGDARRLCLGLASGNTMVPVYARLRTEGFAFPPETRAFAIDEFVWPDADHPGTNAAFFRRHWPAEAGWPPVVVPRANAHDPDAEIERHCRAIAEADGLDVVLLGIGVNGHIAYNEPGSRRGSTCRVVRLTPATRERLRPVWHTPPALAMTLGVREIRAARHVLLLASGAAKAAALRRALLDDPSPEVPASFLQDHPQLTVVCDDAAGGLLPIR
jgi:glucosamine-6-phosphate deaminase